MPHHSMIQQHTTTWQPIPDCQLAKLGWATPGSSETQPSSDRCSVDKADIIMQAPSCYGMNLNNPNKHTNNAVTCIRTDSVCSRMQQPCCCWEAQRLWLISHESFMERLW